MKESTKMIQFFNTLSGKKEEFKPIRQDEIGLYTCGPTVYDYAHIGNFRTFIFEDLLRRFLEFKGYKVKHVMNITDVDDKTIAGARRENVPLEDYTKRFTDAFHDDLKMLNIKPATIEPKATVEIPGMIDLIQNLIAKGIAYEKDGSVYYRVSSFPNYGKLSKKDLSGNISGARVDVDEYEKEQGSDFALWKKSKEGEPAWDSPWGRGRPGWHIECSVMSMKYLGETFDIHAGGEDLVFPHHENEIAQSEAASGKKFVNFWLHAKHLLVNGEKMSKSKGNFYTLRDLLNKGCDPTAIRYALLSTHYRSQLNFTLESLKEANEVIKKLDDCYYHCLSLRDVKYRGEVPVYEKQQSLSVELQEIWDAMLTAFGDDLNISKALSFLFEGIREINFNLQQEVEFMGKKNLDAAIEFFVKLDQLFGFCVTVDAAIPKGLLDLFDRRAKVRGQAEFRKSKELQTESDKFRQEIEILGWLVKDGRPGEPSTVKKKRRVWGK